MTEKRLRIFLLIIATFIALLAIKSIVSEKDDIFVLVCSIITIICSVIVWIVSIKKLQDKKADK